MLFLMNDVVLRLDTMAMAPPLRAHQFHSLSFSFIDRLGCELFAAQPLLHRESLRRAEKLASLIATREPAINAALFVSPGVGCPPDQVQSRYVSLGFEVLTWLLDRQEEGALNHLVADSQVWKRLAA